MPCYVDPPSQAELDFESLKRFIKEVGLKYSTANVPLHDAIQQMSKLLCSFLKAHNVKNYSLELQIWWRDHQRADARHKKEEAERKQRKKLRKQAIAKLTTAERKALNLE